MSDKVVHLSVTSKTANMIRNLETIIAEIKEKEQAVTEVKNYLLNALKSKDVKKVYIDDESEQLLSGTIVTSERKTWDDKAIKKRLDAEKLNKVIKKTIVETIDYDLLAEMVFNGEISEDDFNAMFRTSKTEYFKLGREKRKPDD